MSEPPTKRENSVTPTKTMAKVCRISFASKERPLARKSSIVLAVVLAIFAASPNLGHAQGRGGGFHGGGFRGGFGFRGGGFGFRGGGWGWGPGWGGRLVGLGPRLGLGSGWVWVPGWGWV
jgi:hypothetical protein